MTITAMTKYDIGQKVYSFWYDANKHANEIKACYITSIEVKAYLDGQQFVEYVVSDNCECYPFWSKHVYHEEMLFETEDAAREAANRHDVKN